jgi:predicted nucleic acid-binding protein
MPLTSYLLDAGPLGLLAHDRPVHRLPIQKWVLQTLSVGTDVMISEVADYEVRRELVRLVKRGQLPASRLDRLDDLAFTCTFLHVSSPMWLRAAEFWADARLQGRSTAASGALDSDVLIAAQAAETNATVVTSNPGHIGRWVPVLAWP